MKKTAAVIAAILIFAALCAPAGADESGSIPDDVVITYGYLREFREQIKREIIEELLNDGGAVSFSDYEDITAGKGDIIVLPLGGELIFRGGSACAVSSSQDAGDGLSDISAGVEIFSGDPLVCGHIYLSAGSNAEKAVLVLSESASFTVRGDYEKR